MHISHPINTDNQTCFPKFSSAWKLLNSDTDLLLHFQNLSRFLAVYFFFDYTPHGKITRYKIKKILVTWRSIDIGKFPSRKAKTLRSQWGSVPSCYRTILPRLSCCSVSGITVLYSSKCWQSQCHRWTKPYHTWPSVPSGSPSWFNVFSYQWRSALTTSLIVVTIYFSLCLEFCFTSPKDLFYKSVISLVNK